MESNSRILPKLIAIVGPTGIGKTALSEQIIRYIDSEIVSIDSRQIYRNIDALYERRYWCYWQPAYCYSYIKYVMIF